MLGQNQTQQLETTPQTWSLNVVTQSGNTALKVADGF